MYLNVISFWSGREGVKFVKNINVYHSAICCALVVRPWSLTHPTHNLLVICKNITFLYYLYAHLMPFWLKSRENYIILFFKTFYLSHSSIQSLRTERATFTFAFPFSLILSYPHIAREPIERAQSNPHIAREFIHFISLSPSLQYICERQID